MFKLSFGVLILVVTMLLMISHQLRPASNTAMDQRRRSAEFVSGKIIIDTTFEVSSEGGEFEVTARGKPSDGVVLNIPSGCADGRFTLSVGHNTGSLQVISGIPSGRVIVLKADSNVTLKRPISIGVKFKPKAEYKAVVGYEIDPAGKLHSLDAIDVDMTKGTVSFLTFKQLTLTWVYVVD